MNKLIIGISGNNYGCGKGETTNVFKEHNFIELAYGDKVKEACSIISGLPLHYFYDANLKNKSFPQLGGSTIREFMQFIGEQGRAFCKTIWVDRLLETMRDKELRYGYFTFVISDVRYPNEVLDDMVLIYVEKEISDNNESRNHESESFSRYLKSKAKYVIENNGTISELQNKVLAIYEDIVRTM